MCPACLASIAMVVAAAASAGATALVAAKILPKKLEAMTEPDGDKNASTEDRIQR